MHSSNQMRKKNAKNYLIFLKKYLFLRFKIFGFTTLLTQFVLNVPKSFSLNELWVHLMLIFSKVVYFVKPSILGPII